MLYKKYLLHSQLFKAALDVVFQCHLLFHLIHGRKVFTMVIVLLEDAYLLKTAHDSRQSRAEELEQSSEGESGGRSVVGV